ncbi:MAG: excinuclease ABC subunit A, partial [Bacteroidota bacterium]
MKGARVHNLKNISLELPRNKLIVFTGVSGSGKSSLAFDTIYAEGQRRYVESLSSYARQFLERMDKPDVDVIQGICPAMAIEQKTNTRNPRSTVGTTTEIYDYFRLLFARIGRTQCSRCGRIVRRDSVQTVLDRLNEQLGNTEAKFYVLFPLPEHSKVSLRGELDVQKKRGFFRVLYRNEIVDLNRQSVRKAKKHDVHILVDRLVYRKNGDDGRIRDSLETAFNAGEGYASISFVESGLLLNFNQQFECSECRIGYEEPQPRLFSFNNPFGACPKCQGFGRSIGIDMDLVVPDRSKTLRGGAVLPWTTPKYRDRLRSLMRIAPEANVRVSVPFEQLTAEELDVVMNGYGEFEGVHGFFRMIERKSYKIQYRVFMSRYRGYTKCDACNGARLRPEALSVRIGGRTIHDLVQMSIAQAGGFFANLELTSYEEEVSRRILEELRKRLKYLLDVGIGYLTLNRLSSTLSGGESQRINLATALGSSLVGSLYVLDEPTIGLHPRDNRKLIRVLQSLRDAGNTVLVVEHDPEMIRSSDLVVDLGPGAGEQGGEIVFEGSVGSLLRNRDSLTGKYL